MRAAIKVAVDSFDAESGAIYLGANGDRRLVCAVGDWKGEVALKVALENGAAELGLLELGARRDGAEYSLRDRRLLQQTMEPMARALALSRAGAVNQP